ncbi:hypothetical protein Tco_0665638 [Tanacetum coccineum]
MSSPVISSFADSSKESVGSLASLIVLSDTEPEIIPAILSAEVLSILQTDPFEDPPSSVHAPAAPIISPFLSFDHSKPDSESEPSEDASKSVTSERSLSPEPYEATIARCRSKEEARSSSSLSGSSSPSTLPTSPVEATVVPSTVPNAPICDTFAPVTGTTPTPRLTGGCNRVTARKRFRHHLPVNQPSSHLFESSSSLSGSSSIADASDYVTSSSSTSVGPSRKRSMSSATLVPAEAHPSGALSSAQADVLPPRKRFRGPSVASHYEASAKDNMEADVEADVEDNSEANVGVDIDLFRICAEADAGADAEGSAGDTVDVVTEPVTLDDLPVSSVGERLDEHEEAIQVKTDTERSNLIEWVRALEASHTRLQDLLRVEREREMEA